MNKLNGICFVYDINSTYLTCYFKEFFKWIGVSYAGCFYNNDMDVFSGFEKNQFDVVVDIGRVLNQKDIDTMSQLSKEGKIREILADSQQRPADLLRGLFDKLKDDFFEGEKCFLIDELINIYEKNPLVSLLYDYTSVLFQKVGADCCRKLYDLLKKVLAEVEKILPKYRLLYDKKHEFLIAYALYAKYNCEKMINELLYAQNKALDYDVETYLSQINEIYDYNPDFFKVEYLKAKVADLDSLYRPLGKTYLEFCIDRCPTEVCKSYQYYGLAKWLELDEQPSEAEKVYRLSYKKNPSNVKAIFKLAVYELNREETELAEILLNQIVRRWHTETQMLQIPPRDLEYVYKASRLLEEIDNLSGCYVETADRILQFLHSDLNSAATGTFMEQLYPDEWLRKEICEAMLLRLDARCLIQF